MYALVSDIHSNIEALKAVMADIEKEKVEKIICLGDIIGYGPSPEECIDIAMERFDIALAGNHEWAILNQPVGFSYIARRAAEWHQKVLKPGWFSSSKKKKRWKYLESLQDTYKEGDILFVHASPQNPKEEYLLRSDVDEMIQDFSPKLKKAFSLIEGPCFIGHTHTAGVIFEDTYHFFTPQELDFEVSLEKGRKAIINIGSVGQPRDGSPQSSYMLLDGDKAYYRRVDYDFEQTKEKIFANPYLDDELGKRLVDGR
ncbi:MAG: metallophosphoesterase [Planctomycetota bacterium]|nr:MAG: metallophosphoesterase [Planctomycetota bacterium]